MTASIAAATPKAESKADPDDAITGPIRDVATNPPVRPTALFSPDAAPVWLLSTDINTAVVSGATAPAIPKANNHSLTNAIGAALDMSAASRQEVATRLGDQYVGQNVDALVVKFGPPASTFKMNSGETSYIWQPGNQRTLTPIAEAVSPAPNFARSA